MRHLKRGDLVIKKKETANRGIGWVYETSLHTISHNNPEFSDYGMMVRIVWSGKGLLSSPAYSEWTTAGLMYVERGPAGHKLHPVRMDGQILGDLNEKTQEEMDVVR